MPAYNTAMYIQEAIESVIHQTYDTWELIIVDDCSTDGTKQIIEAFAMQESRIKPIFLNTNSGKPSIAKNKALKEVTGKYIAFLDSDDMWFSNKLELQVKTMEENSHFGLCYTGGNWIDEKGKIINSFMPKYKDGKLLDKMLKRYEINNQSVMITEDSLQNSIQKFNESITIGEDYNLFMHILNKYDGVSIQKSLINYRIRSTAITKNKKRVSDGVLITLKELNLFTRYPLYSLITYLKAIRFKYMKKNWK